MFCIVTQGIVNVGKTQVSTNMSSIMAINIAFE